MLRDCGSNTCYVVKDETLLDKTLRTERPKCRAPKTSIRKRQAFGKDEHPSMNIQKRCVCFHYFKEEQTDMSQFAIDQPDTANHAGELHLVKTQRKQKV